MHSHTGNIGRTTDTPDRGSGFQAGDHVLRDVAQDGRLDDSSRDGVDEKMRTLLAAYWIAA
jgi:hypothetical protein